MHRWKPVFFNIAFALNCGLLFLVVFDQHLRIPAPLQVAGRMHPLMLHFPIALLVLAAFWEAFPQRAAPAGTERAEIGDALLLAASLSAVLTALFGLFLSREPGYDSEVLFWHKWSGILVSIWALGWYRMRELVRRKSAVRMTATALALVFVVVTGHQGANITHGENFLLAPLAAADKTPPVLLEDAVVYTHMVRPILQAKCMGCHNASKAKGELVMDSDSLLLKGGKSGPLWDTSAAGFGLLFQRIHLPLDSRKHMPPRGKPQLTEEEMDILYRWVKGGADRNKKVLDLPPGDTLRALAAALFQTVETDDYSFAAAPESEVRKLNTAYRVVTPLSTGSPALSVEFFSAANFQPALLNDLLPLKEQVVALNLNKMPVTDNDLQVIANFKNLRRLNLSFTNISGATLQALGSLKELRQLSLTGTNVGWKNVQSIASLPHLTQVFLWNTPVTAAELKNAAAQFGHVRFEGGYSGDTVVLKLNPPLVENEEQILNEPALLQLRHVVKGATIRFTTDGSDPDSIHSPVFNGRMLIDKNMVVKAKAFKPGWISSDVVEKEFYRQGFTPDSIRLLQPPNPQYKGDGGATLMDAEKGDQNFRSGKWLGFKETSFSAFVYFKKPAQVTSVTLSSLLNIGSYIMPPQQVDVWGGTDGNSLRLLKRVHPQQPAGDSPGRLTSYVATFAPATVRVMKVVATPLPQLPAWHKAKTQKAWLFVDEIFFQ